ncbi:hypothetical protein GHK28_33430 [Sinorhizobium medicae]|nr:hypothetical protein [Sinorhizobium medicae]MQV53058.1 hypothetical protein [Sinorhizobium medicae]MQV76651.1 hypothetical protein [Sinorhizobium medicae]
MHHLSRFVVSSSDAGKTILLADIRTWDGGIRRFLVDEQCDPDVVERAMADEIKRGL